MNSVVVDLNVGGALFQTTEDSIFESTLISSQLSHNTPTKSPPLFIDRDPSQFKNILYFLRTKRLPSRFYQLVSADDGAVHELEDLRSEAVYFEIDSLVKHIDLLRSSRVSIRGSAIGRYITTTSVFRLLVLVLPYLRRFVFSRSGQRVLRQLSRYWASISSVMSTGDLRATWKSACNTLVFFFLFLLKSSGK